MKKKVVVFGTGQFADVAAGYIFGMTDVELSAFTVDRAFIREESFCDRPVVAFESLVETHPPDEYQLFLPISYKQMNRLREQKYFEAKERGYELFSYISPEAHIDPTVSIGEHCFIMEDNVLQRGVSVGSNCILWSGNHIGHHTTIANHCFIASHVVVSGSVSIGDSCFLGVNATLRDNVNVAPKTLIGAGALVLEDTEEESVHVGTKAKQLNRRSIEVDI
ncbi:MAG: acetyltransferase [Pseudomonadales bacterium]|nr:acetyltransferase [Pseudomonadales bacterium]